MEKEPVYVRIWKLVYPLGIKYLVEAVVTLAAAGIFTAVSLSAPEGAGRVDGLIVKYSNGILLAGNVLVLPVLWKLFRRDEKQGPVSYTHLDVYKRQINPVRQVVKYINVHNTSSLIFNNSNHY